LVVCFDGSPNFALFRELVYPLNEGERVLETEIQDLE
jgi:hypothetical protein